MRLFLLIPSCVLTCPFSVFALFLTRGVLWRSHECAPLYVMVADGPPVSSRAPVSQAAVRAVLLPRPGAGAKDVRTHRVEHPLRVQRLGLEDLRAAAGHVPQRERQVNGTNPHRETGVQASWYHRVCATTGAFNLSQHRTDSSFLLSISTADRWKQIRA